MLALSVVDGDITQLEVDAIANAANDHLWMGAGVAGAIKRSGGAEIEREAVAKGPIEVGDAVVTGAGALPARWVIHGAVMGQDLSDQRGARRADDAALPRARRRAGSEIACAACIRYGRRRVPARRVRAPDGRRRPGLRTADARAGRVRGVRIRRQPGVRRSARREHGVSRLKGLVCAGGEATRLEELTRVTNKHLLPVGRWPMVYYPLELLQLAGIREVLIVTGKQHAGDFIDLLGDGRVGHRDGSGLLFELDLTYKVQTEAGGIAQVVGMAESFAAGDRLVVCLGDNVFEYAEAGAIREFADGNEEERGSSSRKCPTRSASGSSPTERTGRSPTSSRKPASSTGAMTSRPRTTPSSACTASAPTFQVIRSLEPSDRGELEITDSTTPTRFAATWSARASRAGGRRGTYESLARIGTLIEETGVNKVR